LGAKITGLICLLAQQQEQQEQQGLRQERLVLQQEPLQERVLQQVLQIQQQLERPLRLVLKCLLLCHNLPIRPKQINQLLQLFYFS
jgi:hypothetical protein